MFFNDSIPIQPIQNIFATIGYRITLRQTVTWRHGKTTNYIGRGVKLGELIEQNDGLSIAMLITGWYIIYEVLFVGSALELEKSLPALKKWV